MVAGKRSAAASLPQTMDQLARSGAVFDPDDGQLGPAEQREAAPKLRRDFAELASVVPPGLLLEIGAQLREVRFVIARRRREAAA